jgi:hypothetical protein
MRPHKKDEIQQAVDMNKINASKYKDLFNQCRRDDIFDVRFRVFSRRSRWGRCVEMVKSSFGSCSA